MPAFLTPAGADEVPPPVAPPPVAPTPVAPGEAVPLKLTVLAVDGVKSEEPSAGVLNYGALDLLTTSTIEHEFTLRNDNKVPVRIVRLQATCGCTSLLLGEGEEASKTLAPGEQVKVHASVDVTRFHGSIRKAVRAYGTNDTVPLATMTIEASLKEAITFSASQIDFGRVAAGTARSVPLTVTAHPRLATNGTLPKLFSSNPDIQISAIPNGKTVERPAGSTAPYVQRYLLTIGAKASTGPINGVISFTSPAQPHTQGTPSNFAPMDAALQRASVPIYGEVAGRITAMPAMVIFGTGASGKQQVILSSSFPASLQNLKVKSLNPWVVARLVLPPSPAAKVTKAAAKTSPPAPATAVLLELSLKPNAPDGGLETQVVISNQVGDRLNVPVSVYVEPALPQE
ncbi:MAG TPA: DUF1573 domain-containing protein [Abditibacteriaceae bacterium]|nr:DUF1573 domain-containing protein [Abditibacteriaceae bacterium]